jgi:enoyl-CoA hydratase/carnithine racemase
MHLRAKEYALTGKPLSGKAAAEIGLINKAVLRGTRGSWTARCSIVASEYASCWLR